METRRDEIKLSVIDISRDIVRIHLHRGRGSYLYLRNTLLSQELMAVRGKIIKLIDWMSFDDLPEDGDWVIELINFFTILMVKVGSSYLTDKDYWTNEEIMRFIDETIIPKIPPDFD